MIINAITGIKAEGCELLLSGGWDRSLKLWKMNGSEITLTDKIPADIVIHSMIAGKDGVVYAGGSDGHVIRVDIV